MRLFRYSFLMICLCAVLVLVISCSPSENDSSNGNDNSHDYEDYIEITSVQPRVVNEGDETTFIVSFNYNLSSTEYGIVYCGFNSLNMPNWYNVQNVYDIFQKGEGSTSIEITTIPEYLAQPEIFQVYINLSEGNHESSWLPLSCDACSITVNQNDSKSIILEKKAGLSNNSIKCFKTGCEEE